MKKTKENARALEHQPRKRSTRRKITWEFDPPNDSSDTFNIKLDADKFCVDSSVALPLPDLASPWTLPVRKRWKMMVNSVDASRSRPTYILSDIPVNRCLSNFRRGQRQEEGSEMHLFTWEIWRDHVKRSSLGYGYVNFSTPHDAANALEILNFTPINGKPIRIMFSHRDPSLRKSGYANVFIKNLDHSIDNKALHDTFSTFGRVLSCKVAADSNGHSKGYGFVQFDQEEAAQKAIKCLNGMLLNDKQVYVGLFIRHKERNRANGSPSFTNVFVKNLSNTVTDEDLERSFSPCGFITSAVVMKDANGKSRCFGFVNFQSPDSAAAAVEKLNNTTHGDKVWYVGRAQKKAEREAILRANFEQQKISRFEKLQGANLYVKNLGDTINDEKLKELFSEFGCMTSWKVMLDQYGVSKGSGFVAFSTPEEAARAINEMNGKMIGRKPLYVAVAQRKEERKAKLQAHFSQLQAQGVMPSLPSGIPGFHPGAARLAPQHIYFGQGNPGLISSQPAGYGYQQQILPGIHPGVGPNFIIPYHIQRQGQHGNRMGNRRGRNSRRQQQQQQILNHNPNQGYRYIATTLEGIDPSSLAPQGLVGSMMSIPFDASGMPLSPMDFARSGPMPISPATLASALASATPQNQHLMLGEQLYQLVQHLEPKNAGKVTGMLLEMDPTEVLHLIESPDALKRKVAEAMDVLHSSALGSDDVNGQLASLSLTD
ncbi:hypothetical protein Nepgr_033466 [Nepenthes gracilis]|uniref:Polyadenylate-binding protein n=1 Tax=Nepenthes gracilis TaxID=150966 RepID=A0AAD3TMP0_NEPGR|nr:hypothetical protein Nepgr_033466 [Nepenthes gracilis]